MGDDRELHDVITFDSVVMGDDRELHDVIIFDRTEAGPFSYRPEQGPPFTREWPDWPRYGIQL